MRVAHARPNNPNYIGHVLTARFVNGDVTNGVCVCLCMCCLFRLKVCVYVTIFRPRAHKSFSFRFRVENIMIDLYVS